MARAALAALAALALLGAAAAAAPEGERLAVVLELAAPEGTGPPLRREVRAGDTLTYRFVHSASRTPVEEDWVVLDEGPEGPTLRLRAIRFQSTGAGLPSAPEGAGATFETTAAGFAVRGLDRPLALPLELRVSPSAGNALTVGGETIDLTRLPAGDGRAASLLRLTLR